MHQPPMNVVVFIAHRVPVSRQLVCQTPWLRQRRPYLRNLHVAHFLVVLDVSQHRIQHVQNRQWLIDIIFQVLHENAIHFSPNLRFYLE